MKSSMVHAYSFKCWVLYTCLNYNYIRVLMHVLTVFLFKSKIKIYRQNFSCDLIKFLFKLGMFKKKMHIGVRRNFDPGWKLNIETTDVE